MFQLQEWPRAYLNVNFLWVDLLVVDRCRGHRDAVNKVNRVDEHWRRDEAELPTPIITTPSFYTCVHVYKDKQLLLLIKLCGPQKAATCFSLEIGTWRLS